MSPPSTSPSISVMVPVATPALSAQLGWVQVEGLWGEQRPMASVWRARRTARARWGPVIPAQRQIWRDRGL